MATDNHTIISTGAAADAATFNSPLSELDTAIKLNEYAKTTAPGVGDDSGDGYTVGSRWIDTTNDLAYVCLDVTVGAAVWLAVPNWKLMYGSLIGVHLNFPMLLAYWPGSGIDISINPRDFGGNGLHLTGTNGYFAITDDAFPYFYIDATPRYWTHADDADLDFGSEWSMGCVVQFTAASASQEVLMVKGDGSAGATSYMLSRESDGKLRFAIGDGVDLDACIKTASAVAKDTWLIVQCKYYFSTEVTIIVNDVKATNTTAIPAAMVQNAESFGLGANPDGSSPGDATILLRDAWLARLRYTDAFFANMYRQLRFVYGV